MQSRKFQEDPAEIEVKADRFQAEISLDTFELPKDTPIELNGTRFHAIGHSKLGVTLEPVDPNGLNLENWMEQGLDEITLFAREHSAIAIRNAFVPAVSGWGEIGSNSNLAATFPHADYFDADDAELIVLIGDSAERPPTGVVSINELGQAMKAHKDILTEGSLSLSGSHWIVDAMGRAAERLEQEAISPALAGIGHSLYKSLYRDLQLSKIVSANSLSLVSKLVFSLFPRSREDSAATLLAEVEVSGSSSAVTLGEAIASVLFRFRDAVVDRVRPNAYLHLWEANRRSALIIYNRISDAIRPVFHFAVSPQSGDKTDPIRRKTYRESVGKFSGSLEIRN